MLLTSQLEHVSVQEKIIQLSNSLQQQLPNIATVLKDIHSTLRQNEHVVTLLTEEEIATIVSGLKTVTKVELTTKTVAKVSKKSAKSITLEDL